MADVNNFINLQSQSSRKHLDIMIIWGSSLFHVQRKSHITSARSPHTLQRKPFINHPALL